MFPTPLTARLLQGHPWDLEKLLAKLTSSTGTIDLLKQTLRMRARVLGRHSNDPAYLHVLQSSTQGSTVQHGHIQLPAFSVLLLTGHGTRFIDVSFSGGVVVCCGADFYGAFRSCHFHACTVYAVHGAAVSLQWCRFRACVTGLIASGCGSVLVPVRCSFDTCRAGIVAEAGASVRCRLVTITGSFAALTVHGTGTRAALDTCSLNCHMLTPVDIRVVDGAITLRNCTIGSTINALQAMGASAAVELVDVEVRGAQCAVIATGGARVTLRRFEILQPRGRKPDPEMSDTAVRVTGGEDGSAAGVLMMERCSVHNWLHGARGLEILRGGRAALLLCAVVTHEMGVIVGGGGSHVVAQHCSVRSGMMAMLVHTKDCSLRLTGCQVGGREGACVAQEGGAMTANHSQFAGEEPSEGTAVVTAVGGATVRMHAVELRGCEPGLIVAESTVRVSSATVLMSGSADVTASVLLCEGADAELSRCEFRMLEGHEPAALGTAAVKLQRPARAVLEGCRFLRCLVGGGVGGGVHIRNCVFMGPYGTPAKPCAGALVLRGGDIDVTTARAVVEGCSFGAAECCADVKGVAVVIRGCTFAPGAVDALRLREDANVTVAECEFCGCRVGVMLLERARLFVKDTKCLEAKVGIQVEASECEVKAVGCTVQATVACVQLLHREGGCRADLVDCDLSGGGIGLTVGYSTAGVSLVGCKISNVRHGVLLCSAVRAQICRSSISACTKGVHVGGTRADLCLKCGVCGLEGERGWPQVYCALRKSGGRPVDGARCAHEGAMALLSMNDVSVTDATLGVLVTENGHVDATGLRLVRCQAALQEWVVGEASRFEGCSVVGGPKSVERWLVHGPEEDAMSREHRVPGIAVNASLPAEE